MLASWKAIEEKSKILNRIQIWVRTQVARVWDTIRIKTRGSEILLLVHYEYLVVPHYVGIASLFNVYSLTVYSK